MARMWYAGSPADFTVTEDESNDDALVLAPDAELDVYDARTGGSAVTDLLDRTGSPVSSVTTSATGRVLPFQGPDGTSDVLWLDDGVEDRYAVVPHGPFLPLTGGELSGTLSAAAPTTASNVPILAREPDSATGDLGLPGYAGSDTGWRDVTSLLINGWTATRAYLRRTGDIASLHVYQLNAAAQTNTHALTVPVGFRAGTTLGTVGWLAAGATGAASTAPASNVVLAGSNGETLRIAASLSGSQYTTTVQWPCDSTWPASLPGTEITPPASWS